MWIEDINESIAWKSSERHQSDFDSLKKLQGKARNAAASDLFKKLLADLQRFEKMCREPAVAAAIRQHLLNETLKDRVRELSNSLDEVLGKLPKDY
jgi:hypothetical protein